LQGYDELDQRMIYFPGMHNLRAQNALYLALEEG